MNRILSAKLFVLSGILICACAARTAYYENIQSLVSSSKYSDAAKLVEDSRESVYGKKDALLYYLDEGMLLHIDGRYKESNEAFEKAKLLYQELFTKSITTEASTFLISDNMRPYAGEDFERTQINIFCSLNYIMLGQGNEALVEARQADDFLKKLQTDYGYKNVYREDAFARYLMGLIYENQGEINDAYISYKQAMAGYKDYQASFGIGVPGDLADDAIRTAGILGFDDEIRDLKKEWKAASGENVPKGSGELIVLDYNGYSAEKIDDFFEISFGKAWLYVDRVQPKGKEQEEVSQAGAIARSIVFDEQIRLAFPKYVDVPSRIDGFRASVADLSARSAEGEDVQDISSLAKKSLDDRIARIRVKTMARAAVKFALAHKISDKVEQSSGSEMMGWLTKKVLTTASTATEHADKRSWRTLPDKILMARLPLSEGKYSIRLKFYDKNGSIIEEKTIENIAISRGKKTFAIVRTAI